MHHTDDVLAVPGGYEHLKVPATVPDDEVYLREAVANILDLLGYDRSDQHFRRTPERAAKVLLEFANRPIDVEAVRDLLEVSFSDTYDSLVQVGPISVKSMCAHHMLPVYGHAWVGYLPDQSVCGLSKLARVTDYYARQFTVQERVTDLIADALEYHLQPKGVMVVIKAVHGCMAHRGVQEPQALTATSSVRGVFRNEADARAEFLSLMHPVTQR
jgi:GTP cyclohydrolase IA